MLILTRKLTEMIYIDGGRIKVSILGVNGQQVKVGVDAPAEISVHRREIHEKIKKQNDMMKEHTGESNHGA